MNSSTILYPQDRITCEKGFTIIEVMIAIAIFAIGMMAIGKMQLQATNSNTTARLSTELGAFATDQMERMIQISFDDLPTGTADLTQTEIAQFTGLSFSGNYAKDGHTFFETTDGWFGVSCTVDEDNIVDNTKTMTLRVEEVMRSDNRRLTLQHIIPQM